MKKPRTVEQTITVTKTIGQVAFEAYAVQCKRGEWGELRPEGKDAWEAAAEAIAAAVESQIPDDVAAEINAIESLWPYLSRAEDVDCLSAWLKDVREGIAAIEKRVAELHDALGVGPSARHTDAVHEARGLRAAYLKRGEELHGGR